MEPFIPGPNAKLVCENRKVEELYIVRVFLYFTTFREFSKVEKLFNRAKQKVKSLVTGKTDPMADILSQTIGGCEEITCHPKSDEAKKIDPRYSNLIDCGLLLQIDRKCLKAFVQNNG